ncbi:hypothetical protein KUCAC02_012667, partial [Chaenocephalus aceratus]
AKSQKSVSTGVNLFGFRSTEGIQRLGIEAAQRSASCISKPLYLVCDVSKTHEEPVGFASLSQVQ